LSNSSAFTVIEKFEEELTSISYQGGSGFDDLSL
jgi:hypothetical protein